MRNLVIVTSVINISKNPLSYTNVRSIYSPNERFEQTIKTIESIRRKIPNSYILFVESSEIDYYMENKIKDIVDHYTILMGDSLTKINGLYKGAGESTQIYYAIKEIKLEDYDNIFKISGRYWLSDNFNYSNFENSENIFQEREYNQYTTSLATVFYKITNKDLYISTLEYCINSSGMLELNFRQKFQNNFISISPIGIEGNVSVDGCYISW